MVVHLVDIRKASGFTQEQMAKKLEIAPSTYNQYETGARKVPENIATRISVILKVDRDKIFLPTKFTVSKTSI